ncbi:heat shock protein 70-like protein [Leptotrombidium deliense]|uniref:Heat shock protein 70-like protein n=1 Tax=Leptotrombidium deliense TaxID=299467 RepID=A0A443RX96_9ACAR|nr:heat shock protein 70-like protein [Leptotrombidium deliense]
MEVIIPRNTKYPVKGTALFNNAYDDQTELLVQVLQGEFKFVDKNQLLGEFELKIPPKPRGTCKISISFEVNANGFLTVSATELSTGVEQKIEVKDLMQRFSDEEIKEMVKEAERQKVNELKNKARVVAKNDLHSFCFDLRKSLSGSKDFPNASSQQKLTLKQKVEETLYWVDANPTASHEQIKEKTRQIITERDSLRI